MATRSRIGIENPDRTITSVYAHWDGYPQHNGKILLGHYTKEEKIRELIALGDISILAEEIGEKVNYDRFSYAYLTADKHPNWSLFYGRDRGEENVGPQNHILEGWPDSGQEYEYFWSTGKWFYREFNGTFQPLTEEICN